MRLAFIAAPGRGDVDLMLGGLAAELRARGLRCSGTVQVNTNGADAGPYDMDIKVLPDGPIFRISQDLGRAAQGCRLDPAALEAAVGQVAARLNSFTDILIVNKFGKHEAEGRGFRDVIAEALSLGVPVLVGLNRLNIASFQIFAEGLAEELPPERSAVVSWINDVMRQRAEIA